MPVCLPLVVLPDGDFFGRIIRVAPVHLEGPRCPGVRPADDPSPGEAQLIKLLNETKPPARRAEGLRRRARRALYLDPCSRGSISPLSTSLQRREEEGSRAIWGGASRRGGGRLWAPRAPWGGVSTQSLPPHVKGRWPFSCDRPAREVRRHQLPCLQQRQQRGLERAVPHLVVRRIGRKTRSGSPQWRPPFLLRPLQRVARTNG